jgi:hypothetical protein
MSNDDKPVQFRLKLEDEMAQRFNFIKKHYGLESNADLVRLLITMEFNDLNNITQTANYQRQETT